MAPGLEHENRPESRLLIMLPAEMLRPYGPDRVGIQSGEIERAR